MVIRVFIRSTCTVAETSRIAGSVIHSCNLVAIVGVRQVVNQSVAITLQGLDVAVLVIAGYLFVSHAVQRAAHVGVYFKKAFLSIMFLTRMPQKFYCILMLNLPVESTIHDCIINVTYNPTHRYISCSYDSINIPKFFFVL